MTKLNMLIQKCETQKVVSAKLVKGVMGHLRNEGIRTKNKYIKDVNQKNKDYQALQKQYQKLERAVIALNQELEKYRAEENK